MTPPATDSLAADAPLLPAIEMETGPGPRWSVIWLHGLGADGNDFAPIVPELGLDSSRPIRFIFPHAPAIPVTCNNGYVMRAWYDILRFEDIKRHVDEAGIVRSRSAIRALIAKEVQRGIPEQRIVLAGFSQGGAMAYSVGLTHPAPLAGIIALSAYLPSPQLIETEASAANAATPLFAAHGLQDPVVPFALGEQAVKTVGEGRPLEWRRYAMQHNVCPDEIKHIGAWLNALTASEPAAT